MDYLVVYEGGPDGWSAYAPDLPGCIATGASREAVERNMREAVPMHLEGRRAAGEVVPEPLAAAGVVAGPVGRSG
jgi:predicted RNase H-like HicB family nuclease